MLICVLTSFAFLSWQEVRKIRNAHPDDAFAVTNDRVKGSLKVTRAFGAGFLKQVNQFPSFSVSICSADFEIFIVYIGSIALIVILMIMNTETC